VQPSPVPASRHAIDAKTDQGRHIASTRTVSAFCNTTSQSYLALVAWMFDKRVKSPPTATCEKPGHRRCESHTGTREPYRGYQGTYSCLLRRLAVALHLAVLEELDRAAIHPRSTAMYRLTKAVPSLITVYPRPDFVLVIFRSHATSRYW
jgi:hypothetical protein